MIRPTNPLWQEYKGCRESGPWFFSWTFAAWPVYTFFMGCLQCLRSNPIRPCSMWIVRRDFDTCDHNSLKLFDSDRIRCRIIIISCSFRRPRVYHRDLILEPRKCLRKTTNLHRFSSKWKTFRKIWSGRCRSHVCPDASAFSNQYGHVCSFKTFECYYLSWTPKK